MAHGLTVTPRRENVGMSSLTCARCGKPMWQTKKSAPQGKAMCHPCRRERNGLPPLPPKPPRVRGAGPLTCAVCGKGMGRHTKTSLPQGEATCLECRRERSKQRKAIEQIRRSHPRKRVCPMCRRSFETRRHTYCSIFCRNVGSRITGVHAFIRMEGQYRPARWWTRTHDDPRWIIGPPPPEGIDVWVTPTGDVRCPDCTNSMQDAGDTAHECQWCCIRVIFLEPHG